MGDRIDESGQKNSVDAPGVVVGGTRGGFHRSHHIKYVVGFIGILLVIIVGVWFLHSHHSSHSIAKPKTAEVQVDDILNNYTRSKQSAASMKKYQDELEMLEQQASSSTDKQVYAATQARLYEQSQDFDKAISKAKSTESKYKTAFTADTLAVVYETKGDYSNAIKYYKLAANRSPKTGPDERSAYNDYLHEAQSLESKS